MFVAKMPIRETVNFSSFFNLLVIPKTSLQIHFLKPFRMYGCVIEKWYETLGTDENKKSRRKWLKLISGGERFQKQPFAWREQ